LLLIQALADSKPFVLNESERLNPDTECVIYIVEKKDFMGTLGFV
jgi:hypothetical protein